MIAACSSGVMARLGLNTSLGHCRRGMTDLSDHSCRAHDYESAADKHWLTPCHPTMARSKCSGRVSATGRLRMQPKFLSLIATFPSSPSFTLLLGWVCPKLCLTEHG